MRGGFAPLDGPGGHAILSPSFGSFPWHSWGIPLGAYFPPLPLLQPPIPGWLPKLEDVIPPLPLSHWLTQRDFLHTSGGLLGRGGFPQNHPLSPSKFSPLFRGIPLPSLWSKHPPHGGVPFQLPFPPCVPKNQLPPHPLWGQSPPIHRRHTSLPVLVGGHASKWWGVSQAPDPGLFCPFSLPSGWAHEVPGGSIWGSPSPLLGEEVGGGIWGSPSPVAGGWWASGRGEGRPPLAALPVPSGWQPSPAPRSGATGWGCLGRWWWGCWCCWGRGAQGQGPCASTLPQFLWGEGGMPFPPNAPNMVQANGVPKNQPRNSAVGEK